MSDNQTKLLAIAAAFAKFVDEADKTRIGVALPLKPPATKEPAK